MTVGTKAFSPAERLLMVGRNDATIQSELKVLEPLMSSGRSLATTPRHAQNASNPSQKNTLL